MALDYTGNPGGIFRQIGVCAKHAWLLGQDSETYDADRQEVESNFDAADQGDKSATVRSGFDSLREAFSSLRRLLANVAASRITDRETVVLELDLDRNDFDTVIRELIRQMVVDGETVKASVVSVGSPTPDPGNVGDGTVLVDKVLDGVTPPGSGLRTYPELSGVASELVVTSDVFTLNCTADSYTDGNDVGEEEFTLYGEMSDGGNFSEPEGGSGTGTTISTVQSENMLRDGGFEQWSGNSPSRWSVDSGTAGTHVKEETTEVFRGDSSLALVGDGTQATISVSQSVDDMETLRRYVVCFRYKANAADTSSQKLTVQFSGTGYTPAGSEKVEITGNNFSTGWTLKYFYVNVPADRPEDWSLTIAVTGTLGAGKKVFVDDVCVAPVVWHGGVNFCVVAGQTPFLRNDRFKVMVSNNNAGRFSWFFRRAFGIQLPSATGGGHTIPDTLAGGS